ncbi:transposase [Streptomyces sp. DT24]|uniref:transposase n=1 Tax=unclassified Streptomyces TaxID=2593676 RepID=UPI003CEA4A6A
MTRRIIQQIHADSGGIHASPRVHAVMKSEGVHAGRKRVERLIREAGPAGISPCRADKGFTRRAPDTELAPTWCNATSRPADRTGCGSPTSP